MAVVARVVRDGRPFLTARLLARPDPSRLFGLVALGVLAPLSVGALLPLGEPGLRHTLLYAGAVLLAGALAAPLVYRLHPPRGLPQARLTPLGLAKQDAI